MTDKKVEEQKKDKKSSNKPKEEKKWLTELLPKLRGGLTVRVHQKIREKNTKGEEKERIQIFEGIILQHKGGKGKNATITVRKIAVGGIGVERIFPIHSPVIKKIEAVKQAKLSQARPYYLRSFKKRLKEEKI